MQNLKRGEIMKENNLPKILDIGGIEYIQKTEYDKAKKDIDNIKQLVSSSIAGLNDFLGTQVIAQNPKQIKKEIKEAPKREGCYALRNPKLKIRKSGQREYHIIRMDKTGNFWGKPNKKLIFNIHDVMAINKRYSSQTSKDDVAKMARDCQLPVDTTYRIIYNLDKNILKPYIKEWLSTVNDIKIKTKKTLVQNNPQKRKEMGIYS